MDKMVKRKESAEFRLHL